MGAPLASAPGQPEDGGWSGAGEAALNSCIQLQSDSALFRQTLAQGFQRRGAGSVSDCHHRVPWRRSSVGFVKVSSGAIEFLLLLQRSTKSCTVWERRGKDPTKPPRSDSANPNAGSAARRNPSSFRDLTTYGAPKKRLVRAGTAAVASQTSVWRTEERFQSCCEIVRLWSSGSTRRGPETEQTNSPTQMSST